MGKSGGKSSSKSVQYSVKVGNLKAGTTIEELREAFVNRGIDTMVDVYIPPGRNYGFIRFSQMSEARNAAQCAGMMVNDEQITCELAETDKKSPEEMEVSHYIAAKGSKGFGWKGMGKGVANRMDDSHFSNEVSIKVSNLPEDATPEEVVEAFAGHGIDSMSDVHIPRGRRFGFLRFKTVQEGKHALFTAVTLRGQPLEMEPAMGGKRSAQDMAVQNGEMAMAYGGGCMQMDYGRPAKTARMSWGDGPGSTGGAAPRDSNVSADAPSVKVSNVPPGTTSDMLHQALVGAGCSGEIVDVYVPKGDRGFAFVRFRAPEEAHQAAQLVIWAGDQQLGMEVAVSQRKQW